jgi:hypothetical protein
MKVVPPYFASPINSANLLFASDMPTIRSIFGLQIFKINPVYHNDRLQARSLMTEDGGRRIDDGWQE